MLTSTRFPRMLLVAIVACSCIVAGRLTPAGASTNVMLPPLIQRAMSMHRPPQLPFTVRPATNTYKHLYTFAGTPDGASPLGGLTLLNGVLYGTTLKGSVNYCGASCQSNDCYLGCGTVFQLDARTESIVYNFQGKLQQRRRRHVAVRHASSR